METPDIGAYGLAIAGLDEERGSLAPASADWPRVQVVLERAAVRPRALELTATHAAWPTGPAGETVVDRAAGVVRIREPGPLSSTSAVHPRLGMAGAVFAQWLGREAFHAGAFVHRGAAWAVVGEREDGKSTLMAALTVAGVPVVTDDTLVVDDGLCLSGVRCLDLRGDAPEHLGVADRAPTVREGARRRLFLPPPPPPTPLAGWFFLRWGDEVSVREVPAARRPARIAGLKRWHRRGVPDAHRLLALSALPAWELQRPRDWARLPDTVDAALTTVESAGRGRAIAT